MSEKPLFLAPCEIRDGDVVSLVPRIDDVAQCSAVAVRRDGVKIWSDPEFRSVFGDGGGVAIYVQFDRPLVIP